MIEILIPTYNRSKYLVKNILHIDTLIKKEDLGGKFRIMISNNDSTDDTNLALEQVKNKVGIELVIYQQETNVGLEKNAIFILENATSDYVIFLGDDDYFPDGYLTKLLNISNFNEYGVVIPGVSSLTQDGVITPARADLKTRSHEPGFNALLDFSHFGHQLSGLFFEREGVVEAYKADEKNRNIYLFIFFIGFVMQRRPSLYAPGYQVLVTEGNSKDWSYDASGLLTEIFRNINALYPNDRCQRVKLCIQMMKRQSWRIRLGKNPLLAVKSFSHLLSSKDLDILLKALLPIIYSFLYLRNFAGFVKRKLS